MAADDISDVTLGGCESPRYVKLRQMDFLHNGRNRSWELFLGSDSVVTVLYHPKKDSFIFVKQFRPAVYVNRIPKDDRDGVIDTQKYPTSLGYTMELCAGIVDKPGTSLVQHAHEEILEECGYFVPVEKIEKITSCRSNVGTGGNTQTMFYAEVEDSMKQNDGGGVDDESIEIVFLDREQAFEMAFDESVARPLGLILCLQWWKLNKEPLLER